MPTIDTPFIRGLFPTFASEATAENAYFTHAGGTFACLQVQGRQIRFMRTRLGEPGNDFAPSADAAEEMDEARTRLAAMLGVVSHEVHFGPSTAMNAYALAEALGDRLTAGDAIVVTQQDREPVSGAWRRLAQRGVEVREWPVDPETGHLEPADLAHLLDDRVRLVSFPHASDVIGEVNPVAGICALVRAAGAISVVDGAAYAPHGLPDVYEMGADVYLFSAHKCFGPHQGIMVTRGGLAGLAPNLAFPGNDTGLWTLLADRDCAQVAACAGIADYYDALHDHHFGDVMASPRTSTERVSGMIAEFEQRLAAPVIDFLSYRNSVRVLGPRDATRRTSVVSAAFDRPAREIQAALADRGVMTSAGHFGSGRALRAMGLDAEQGVLRIAPMHYNSTYEVDRLIETLERIL